MSPASIAATSGVPLRSNRPSCTTPSGEPGAPVREVTKSRVDPDAAPVVFEWRRAASARRRQPDWWGLTNRCNTQCGGPLGERSRRRTSAIAVVVVVDTRIVDCVHSSSGFAARWRHPMFRRHRDLVVVPNVIGMSPSKAKRAAAHAGLWLRGPEADAGPLGKSDLPTGVITAQAPTPGSLVDPGSALAVWIDRNDDGGGGMREPRRPLPDPRVEIVDRRCSTETAWTSAGPTRRLPGHTRPRLSLRPQPAWEADAWCCCRCAATILTDSGDADGWTVHPGDPFSAHPVIFPVCPRCAPELRTRYWGAVASTSDRIRGSRFRPLHRPPVAALFDGKHP